MRRLIGLLAMMAGLFAAPARAAESWFEARTDHFKVIAQSSAQFVGDFATKLERLDKVMRYIHDVPERPGGRANPLAVYVVPDVETVQRLCRAEASKKSYCTNVYGFYDEHIGESVAFTPRHAGNGNTYDLGVQAVLFHEYAHHFMFGSAAAAYPAWYQEGFAEFNARTDFNKDGSANVGKPPLYRVYGIVNTPLSIRALLTQSTSSLSGEAREALYGKGWLLTHYLTFSKTRAGQLTHYLRFVNEGRSSLAAGEAAFGDLKALDLELFRYTSRPLSVVRVDADRIKVAAPTLRPLGAGEVAMLPVRWQSRRGVDKATAPAVVEEARRRAAPFPADAAAQDALAEAEFDAGHDDAAEAAADRALAADAQDRTAMLYKGRARLRRVVAAQKGDTPAWRDARGWFVKANRAEPDDARPLVRYYESFLAAGLTPPLLAVQGLERAFELSPQAKELRFLLARQFLVDRQPKDARAVLAPLAFDPHAGPDNPAAKLVALIDAGDTAGVAKLLTLGPKEGDAGD